jgi:hypothetical protein
MQEKENRHTSAPCLTPFVKKFQKRQSHQCVKVCSLYPQQKEKEKIQKKKKQRRERVKLEEARRKERKEKKKRQIDSDTACQQQNLGRTMNTKNRRKDQAWRSTAVIPATLEVKTGGSWFKARPGNVSKTSLLPCQQKVSACCPTHLGDRVRTLVQGQPNKCSEKPYLKENKEKKDSGGSKLKWYKLT